MDVIDMLSFRQQSSDSVQSDKRNAMVNVNVDDEIDIYNIMVKHQLKVRWCTITVVLKSENL